MVAKATCPRSDKKQAVAKKFLAILSVIHHKSVRELQSSKKIGF